MSDQKIEELRQLVRERGPALLIDLAKLMPESMLDSAVSIAGGFRERSIRAHALSALAARMPEEDRLRIQEVLRREEPAPGAAPPSSLNQLKQILSGLSEAEQESLILMALDEIQRATEQKKSAKPPRTLGGGQVISRGPAAKRGSKSSAGPKRGGTRASKSYVPKRGTDGGGGGDPEPPSESTKSVDFDPSGHGGTDAVSVEAPAEAEAPAEGPVPVGNAKRQDIVNLGFSKKESPDTTDAKETLKCGETYLFWLEVGQARADNIEVKETPLMVEELPREEQLVVALFSFKDELEIFKDEDIGELQITERMTVEVARQPMNARRRPASSRLQTCLFFPVRVPNRVGVYRLRCNIYCKQTLIQSRLISVVAQTGAPEQVDSAFFEKEQALFSADSPLKQYGVALYSEADFILSQALTPALLPQTPHRLSLMLNSNDDGTHSFRFFGKNDKTHLKDDARIDEGELKDIIRKGRAALRQASWGSIKEWSDDAKYIYDDSSFDPKTDTGKLAKELAKLAVAGYRIYSDIVRQLTNNKRELRQLMAEPGLVQIALKKSSRHVFPAALLYDYPYDTQAVQIDTSTFELCKSFDAAMRSQAPLEEADCFKGKCWLKAEHDKSETDLIGDLAGYVCPSGFWGYRHAIGFPLTLGNTEDVPEEMKLGNTLEVVYGYSTDFDPTEHVQKLQNFRSPVGWHPAGNRRDVLQLLLQQKPHLVYFYCHGGVTATGVPFIEVGERDMLEPSNFSETYWEEPRPLVFINGCHTTAMDPEVAIKFVEAFVQDARASGVIGTEITIFEPLARAFAEDCLRRFLGGAPFKDPVPLGEAVRGARLALLKKGNPLGLVYIPFASAGLRLVKQ